MVICDICLVTFPNSPTMNSGRGLDRYAYELTKGIRLQSTFDVHVIDSRAGRADYLFREAEMAVQLKHVKAKVFHATSEYGLASLLLAKKRPIVVTIHDLLPQFFFKYSPIVFANQRVHLKFAKRADRVIATSNFYSRLLHQNLGVAEDRIEVIHYGVDHEIFRSTDQRERTDKPTILYLGGLNSLKGSRDLVEAFSRLSNPIASKLVIGGKGRYEMALKEVAREVHAADRIDFRGFVGEDRLPDLYASVDALVWPSYTGFGLSTLEAMACGTPVVAAQCLDSGEYLGAAANMYSVGDVEQLVKALEAVLSSPSAWKSWSAKATMWSENFAWSKMTKKICSAYEEFT